MDFFLIGIIYWLLIGASILLFIWGLLKKSWKSMFYSGLALLLPILSLYFGGANGWLNLSILVPLTIFIIAFLYKRKN